MARRPAKKLLPPAPQRMARRLTPNDVRTDPAPVQKPTTTTDPRMAMSQRSDDEESFSRGVGESSIVRASRDVGLRSSTGRAEARGLTDVRPVDMIPMGSSAPGDRRGPRVREAGYDEVNQIIRVTFRDGTPWAYYNVPPEVWHGLRTADSPGRYINAVLNEYPYGHDASRGAQI